MNSLGTRVTLLPHNSTIVRMWGTQTTRRQALLLQVVLESTTVAHGQAPPAAQPTTTWLLRPRSRQPRRRQPQLLRAECGSTGSRMTEVLNASRAGIHSTETNVAMRMTPLTQRTENRTLFRRVSKRKAPLLQASIPGNERSPHQRIRPLDGMQDGRSGLHAPGVIPR